LLPYFPFRSPLSLFCLSSCILCVATTIIHRSTRHTSSKQTKLLGKQEKSSFSFDFSQSPTTIWLRLLAMAVGLTNISLSGLFFWQKKEKFDLTLAPTHYSYDCVEMCEKGGNNEIVYDWCLKRVSPV